jgi:hypothetical protein
LKSGSRLAPCFIPSEMDRRIWKYVVSLFNFISVRKEVTFIWPLIFRTYCHIEIDAEVEGAELKIIFLSRRNGFLALHKLTYYFFFHLYLHTLLIIIVMQEKHVSQEFFNIWQFVLHYVVFYVCFLHMDIHTYAWIGRKQEEKAYVIQRALFYLTNKPQNIFYLVYLAAQV